MPSGGGKGAAGGTITLTVDYGDGAQKRFSLPWREGMTVLDALAAAAEHPRGITFRHRFAGEKAFVDQIDDAANQGAGAGARNWVFRVNDRLADRSCGAWTLQAGDVVVWSYGKFEDRVGVAPERDRDLPVGVVRLRAP